MTKKKQPAGERPLPELHDWQIVRGGRRQCTYCKDFVQSRGTAPKTKCPESPGIKAQAEAMGNMPAERPKPPRFPIGTRYADAPKGDQQYRIFSAILDLYSDGEPFHIDDVRDLLRMEGLSTSNIVSYLNRWKNDVASFGTPRVRDLLKDWKLEEHKVASNVYRIIRAQEGESTPLTDEVVYTSTQPKPEEAVPTIGESARGNFPSIPAPEPAPAPRVVPPPRVHPDMITPAPASDSAQVSPLPLSAFGPVAPFIAVVTRQGDNVLITIDGELYLAKPYTLR